MAVRGTASRGPRPQALRRPKALGSRLRSRGRSLWVNNKDLWYKFLGTATTANWNVTYRQWFTTLAPIPISYSRSVVIDQRSASSGRTNFC